jgi:hypothetical protein
MEEDIMNAEYEVPIAFSNKKAIPQNGDLYFDAKAYFGNDRVVEAPDYDSPEALKYAYLVLGVIHPGEGKERRVLLSTGESITEGAFREGKGAHGVFIRETEKGLEAIAASEAIANFHNQQVRLEQEE